MELRDTAGIHHFDQGELEIMRAQLRPRGRNKYSKCARASGRREGGRQHRATLRSLRGALEADDISGGPAQRKWPCLQ